MSLREQLLGERREQAGVHEESAAVASAASDPFHCDPDALALFRSGDRATLERIYWTHVDRIEEIVRGQLTSWRRSHGRRSPDARDVEDLVQDTFVRAFRPRARMAYDGQREYWPYLSAIARNVLVDAMRTGRGALLIDPTAEMDDRPADTPAGEDADWAEPRAVAVAKLYLARLPVELAGVHHHRFVVGSSQDLAAKALNLTRQRLRTLEKKLRNGLARELKRAGIPTKG